MAKLKRNFLRGRMNKDLDERLVPNGEYRDALNIQVSTSEGSDVGAIENLLGNTKKNAKPSGGSWDPAFGLNNTKCIGVVRDGQNNKIYWFITSEASQTDPKVDAILEYDQAFGTVEPVLVDTTGVLGFDPEYLITGVNILEGLLYWTDDLNEPKVINIAAFKAGSSQGANTDLSVHTQIFNRNFVEKDVTVITEAPGQVLNVLAEPSLIGGDGTGITPITTNFTTAFADAENGDSILVDWSVSGSIVTWPSGSRATFTAEIEQEDGSIDKYQVVGEFTAGLTSASSGTITVESATPSIIGFSLQWEMLLIEDDPIFKNDFPRFSYRYKYTDGRYSTYAPFSKAAFVPGKFEYLSRDGNNEGMNSVIRKITLSGFPTRPLNVEEIEVLYKGASSNNIYVIETLSGPGPFGTPQQVITLGITSGVLGPVVESLQLLRLYDNVPRKAKSQEIVANRIVYGNYLQNYDVVASDINVSAFQYNITHANPGYGITSIKTDREYQLAVSFVDNYGRESPVFTSSGGAITFSGENSSKVNLIEPVLSASSVPSWATHFKYYIKDAAPAYYNIALDRYYDAEDSSVWLSFPSSERNKLEEGKYMSLKKQHDSSNAVTINNRYKVLSISAQAPDYLTEIDEVIARERGYATMASGAEGFITGENQMVFWAPVRDANPVFHDGFKKGNTITFISENNSASSFSYTIFSGGPTGITNTVNGVDVMEYNILVNEALKTSDSWLSVLPDERSIQISLSQKISKALPEFEGRFFAKISPNATFFDSVPSSFKSSALQYVEDFTGTVSYSAPFAPGNRAFYWLDTYNDPGYTATGGGAGVVNGVSEFHIFEAYSHVSSVSTLHKKFKEALQAPGTKIKFKQSNGTISEDFYSILKIEDANGDYGEESLYSRANVSPPGEALSLGNYFVVGLDRPYDDTVSTSPVGIVIYREKIKAGTPLLSSNNPAVFETEPDEQADLDIYWEASGLVDAADAGLRGTSLNWFNCYSFGNGVESDRIRDDFNAPVLGKGVRVNAELQEPYKQERRASGLIYGGLYNSLSSVNNTNQFIAGIKITKDLDPQYGGIQKLHSRDTNLVAFAEDKVFRILADKDALYNADGNVNLTSTNRVLGDASTFAGEFGISKNPESFATYGFRSYFADKSRGAVLRLSADGITEISEKGMSDYFIDKFRTVSTPLIGSFDEDTSSYSLVVGGESVSFKEKVDGWPTRLSYVPEFGTSLNNEYYTFNNGELYEHSNATRNNFYGVQSESSVEMIFNDAPSSIKNFKTLAYEGSDRWTAVVNTDKQSGEVNNWRDNEGLYFNFIKGTEATWDNVTQTGTLNSKEFSVQGLGTLTADAADLQSTFEITIPGALNDSLQLNDYIYYKDAINGRIYIIGKVTAITGSVVTVNVQYQVDAPEIGDFVFFAKSNEKNISGLLGYYGSVTLTNAAVTKSELFGVSSEVFISSE